MNLLQPSSILLVLLCSHTIALHINGRELELHNEKVNWFKASESCRRHGMQLVTVRSRRDSEDVLSTGRDYGQEALWTAATDLAASGTWTWSSTGTAVSEDFWLPGEPREEEEAHCMEAVMGAEVAANWRVADCQEKRAFMCEDVQDAEEKVKSLTMLELVANSRAILAQFGVGGESEEDGGNSTVTGMV